MPTHNRPELFKRALGSVLTVLDGYNIEIIIRCDDNSITKEDIPVLDFVPLYHTTKDINGMYQELYEKSTGDYIYYLEDDDFILPYFKKCVDYMFKGNSLLVGLHKSVNQKINKLQLAEFTSKKDHFYVPDYFQLGQMIFDKRMVTEFPSEYHDENDEHLLRNILTNAPLSETKYVVNYIFTQGVDNQNLTLKEILDANP